MLDHYREHLHDFHLNDLKREAEREQLASECPRKPSLTRGLFATLGAMGRALHHALPHLEEPVETPVKRPLTSLRTRTDAE